jgi:predicted RNase H-like nuclease (RuvC/YqgF family)
MKKVLNEQYSEEIDTDNTSTMYNVDNTIISKKDQTLDITTNNKGITTVVNIDGKNIEFVNLEYVRTMQRIISNLTDKIQRLERNISNLSININRLSQNNKNLNSKLDGKIDRE